jgi:PAS domain S-box-containing protein
MLVACAFIALLTALKFLLRSIISEPTPFLLYFTAIVGAAWAGGLSAGVFATLASGLLANHLFIDHGVATIPTRRELVPLTVFVAEGLAIAWVTSRLQRERRANAIAEAEARATAGKLDAVLASVADGITVQDDQGRVIYANQAAARITGFASPDAFLDAEPAEIYRRFTILHEDGSPLAPHELPGRQALTGQEPDELLVRFRVAGQSDDHFSVVRASAVRDADGKVVFAVNTFRDVTQKRTQDEAVRVAREWFSTALRSIGDAVVTTDREGRVTFLNPVAEQLTGWTHADAQGRPLREVFVIVHEETRAPAESPVERVLREGKIVGLANHTVLAHRRGGEAAIDDSAAPIRSESGELVGVVLVFRDVSVKRRDEERRNFLARAATELTRSLDVEATLGTLARLAVPTIADWCAVDLVEGGVRKRLGIAHVDPKKLAFVGEIERAYPPDADALTGVPNVLRTGRPEMIAEIPARLIEAAARDPEHLRLVQQLALHSYICVPIKRGEAVVGAITFVMAESRRVYGEQDLQLALALADRAGAAIDNALLYPEAEEARRDAASGRDRLETMIMSAPIAIMVLRGPHFVVDMVNELYLRVNPRMRIGVPIAEVAADPANVRMLERVHATGQPYVAVEQPVPRASADGTAETIFLDYTALPLRDHEGAIESLVVFASDVTEQALARQRVEAARAQAEAANRSKDEFLAMLGHELRNPLAPILTALQLMSLRGSDALDHERQVIERQVKHVVRLVDDLLDVSRITRGKVVLERERVELAEVVADAIEIASPLLEHGRHVLETQVPRHGLAVNVDRLRLAQVIANLLTNSAKYTESGGRIEVVGARAGERVVLRVRDNGIGIAPEMLPRVFDLFVQEQQTIDRSRGGLGLGLTIVKNLVALHDGEVSARSEGNGKGSEFAVSLPAAGDEPAVQVRDVAAPDAPPVAPGAMVSSRILIVDDNEDAADMLSMVLEARGYATRVAHDGPSALQAAEEFRPQTALLDIGLPVMDGFELARRLRANPTFAGLRLVALTGYGQDTDRKRSQDAGFDHHLVKPIDVKSVVAILATPHP